MRIMLRNSLAALALGLAAHTACAQVVTYTDSISFNAAAPGTIMTDFEAGIITTPSTGNSMGGTLNSTSNNGVFSPGSLPAGINFNNACAATDLILVGPGYDSFGWSGTAGLPSKGLLPSNDACSLRIDFSTPVHAVGMDIYAESDSGYRVGLYGAGNSLIGNFDGSANETVAGFFGAVSTTAIHHVVVKAPSGTNTGSFEVIDNVAFSTAPPASAITDPNSIPTLNALGLALTTIMLLAAGVHLYRRKTPRS